MFIITKTFSKSIISNSIICRTSATRTYMNSILTCIKNISINDIILCCKTFCKNTIFTRINKCIIKYMIIWSIYNYPLISIIKGIINEYKVRCRTLV